MHRPLEGKRSGYISAVLSGLLPPDSVSPGGGRLPLLYAMPDIHWTSNERPTWSYHQPLSRFQSRARRKTPLHSSVSNTDVLACLTSCLDIRESQNCKKISH